MKQAEPKVEPLRELPPISLSEALSVAESYVRDYRAFAKLREVLHAAVGAEGVLAALDTQKRNLDGEIAGLRELRETARADMARDAQKAEAEAAQRAAAAAEVLEKIQRDIATEQARYEQAKRDAEHAAAQGQAAVDALHSEVVTLEAQRTALKAELDSLLAKYRRD
jgi:chromosome segregation ATPase